MTTFYIQTTGNAGYSGSTDSNTPIISGVNGVGTGVSVTSTTVTFPAGTVLTAITTTPGAAQDTIYIADATNSNRKIFKIVSVAGSGGATPTCVVDTAPTGTITQSAWAVGGRHVLTNASIEGAVLAGDTVIFNDSPASQAAVMWTFRTAGDVTSGIVKIKGKTGTRPVLTTTNTSNGVSSAVYGSWIENLEIAQQGATGSGIALSGGNAVVFNVKISDAGGNGITITGNPGQRIMHCEITGCGADGINTGQICSIASNYIHDVIGDGIESSAGGSITILNNIIDTCAARGIFLSGAVTANSTGFSTISGNTIYGCGNSGIEITDVDNVLTITSNLLMNNGDAAGESNVEMAAGTVETLGFHGWNVLYNNSGADAPIGFTVNALVAASEFTTDPLMTDPANADFRIASTSPARASGPPVGLVT